MKKVMVCAGTRPEIIKMAPVYHALKQAGAEVQMLHTGQHVEMAWPLYRFFDMPPVKSLEPRRRGACLSTLSASVLEQAALAMEALQPDVVLVQGDTTSALMCGMAAYYARIPVGHVEAGLRTYETDPFPEEKNRELLARLATWHFTPTPQASKHLAQEFIRGGIHQVGNTVVDAVHLGQARLATFVPDDVNSQRAAEFMAQHKGRRLVLVTAHRRENWGEPMARIAGAVRDLVAARSDIAWIWPMHQNPAVRDTIATQMHGLSFDAQSRLLLTEPADYPSLLQMLDRCVLTLTDSGGIQEEAATLRRPVIVMRDSTERQELIDARGGVLVGADPQKITQTIHQLLDDPAAYAAMQITHNPFGDGLASSRIAQILDL